MRIVIRERSGQVTGQVPLQNTVPRIGMWGTVTDVDSTRNAVNVRLTGGVLLEDVPVASLDEWICEFKDEGYLSGSRNLPPENARVFVLMPTGTFEGAFVLCSSLSMFEKEHQKKFMSTKEQRTEKNVERLRVRPGKWIEKYNYKTGQLELTSSNENVKIAIADDNNKKEEGSKIREKEAPFLVKTVVNTLLEQHIDSYSLISRCGFPDELLQIISANTLVAKDEEKQTLPFKLNF
ncbi:hypothetical protein [Treponema phagedenis]|uniref:hypothetical protein n=1 Tax=Treponema phagedenis TaxID=162 RepID=UPI0015A3F89A|nr:hypothetical protein [Treponema phagedenis]NVP23035.1 hypothetical protein [Treponema phagedenis]QLC57909.1 hypothetical protein HW453_03135 [Treponema phagedenis]